MRSHVTEFVEEVFHDPIPTPGLECVRGRAVLPDGVTKRLAGIGLQSRLCQKSGDESRQHIATAALREMRIAR